MEFIMKKLGLLVMAALVVIASLPSMVKASPIAAECKACKRKK